jgi:hypothetical protein
VHDSIEDARTALALWRVFCALQDGVSCDVICACACDVDDWLIVGDGAAFRSLLTKLYQIGRSIEWNVDKLDSSVQELLFDELQLIKKA